MKPKLERNQQIVAMRKKKKTFRQISDELGISEKRVSVIFNREILRTI